MASRFGAGRITSIDVDDYPVEVAQRRLQSIGLSPRVLVGSALESLPGRFDRIVATVGMPRNPRTWLEALNPGGRLVTTIAGTSVVMRQPAGKRLVNASANHGACW